MAPPKQKIEFSSLANVGSDRRVEKVFERTLPQWVYIVWDVIIKGSVAEYLLFGGNAASL